MSEHTHDWSIRRENVHGTPDVWCECACGAVVPADYMPQILRDLAAASARVAELVSENDELYEVISQLNIKLEADELAARRDAAVEAAKGVGG